MTRKFGIIGCPIEHSVSPVMHNAAFEHCKIDAVYNRILVNPEDLKTSLIKIFKEYEGFNITIPHKTKVISFLEQKEDMAKQIGAVNTAYRHNNQWIGANTDVYGFTRCLKEQFGSVQDKTCTVLGSGGAARAVIFSLIHEGIGKIKIFARDSLKSAAIISDVEKINSNANKLIEYYALKNQDKKSFRKNFQCDVLVNTTPSGMKKDDSSYFDFDLLNKNMFVYDLIYNPPMTPLLDAAKKIGCLYVNGLDMLLYQGAESFHIWTGVEPPIDVMRQALQKAIYG